MLILTSNAGMLIVVTFEMGGGGSSVSILSVKHNLILLEIVGYKHSVFCRFLHV